MKEPGLPQWVYDGLFVALIVVTAAIAVPAVGVARLVQWARSQ